MIAPNASRRAARVVATTLGLALALAVPRVGLAQAKACVRTATGAFTPNGIVASGATLGNCMPNGAWSRVVPLNMTAGVATANALTTGTISFTYYSGFLYLGFTVAQDADLNVLDGVVVAVDRTGNGWDEGDFFLRVRPDTAGWGASNPRASPSGGTACNGNTIVEYYRFSQTQPDSNVFILDNTTAGQITARIAYDYETAVDGETNLWNLEIKIPTGAVSLGGHSYFGIATAGFSMGAYVFADLGANQSGETGMVLRWPDSIGDRAISQWDLNTPALNAASLAQLNVNDVCFDMNWAATPLTSNSMTEVNRNGPTRFTAWYYFAGPGMAQAAGTNTGDVHIKVYSFTGTTGWQTIWDAKKTETIDGYNQPHHSIFDMAIPGGNEPTDFCSDVYLEGWQKDDDRTDVSNHVHVNYIPFATSQVTKRVNLAVDSVPGLAPGASTSLLLNISASNDPGGAAVGTRSPRGSRGSAGMFLLAGVFCLGAAGAVRRRAGAVLLLVLVGTVAIVNGCRPKVPPIATARWSLSNAAELGLTPIKGESGWYRMPARRGELKRAEFEFTGRPLPYQTLSDSLPMAADSTGRPVARRIAVRSGQVVSVFALGTVDVDGPDGPLAPTDANGLVRKNVDLRLSTAAAAIAYPVGRGRYVPAENIGTLVGSFDGFKTSFIIGTNASFVVPRGAEQLALAVNGAAVDYRRAAGSYRLKWIITEPPTVPTATSYAFDTPYDQPVFVAGWLVLTSVHVRTFYEVPMKDPKTGAVRMGRAELGEAHMSIYESH